MVDKNQQVIDKTLDQEYKYGFTTDVDQEKFDPGLDEEVIKKLSKIKNEPQAPGPVSTGDRMAVKCS